jgi:hypothetical protein
MRARGHASSRSALFRVVVKLGGETRNREFAEGHRQLRQSATPN